jgi:hypothetical protein
MFVELMIERRRRKMKRSGFVSRYSSESKYGKNEYLPKMEVLRLLIT